MYEKVESRFCHIQGVADLADLGCNEGIPSAAHAWEEVVLYLKVESTPKITRDGTSIRRGSFHLGLEPTNAFTRLFVRRCRITIVMDKVCDSEKSRISVILSLMPMSMMIPKVAQLICYLRMGSECSRKCT